MESMVDLIATVEMNIKETENLLKEKQKEYLAVRQELDNLSKNLTMFKDAYKSLVGIKNNEIEKALGDNTPVIEKATAVQAEAQEELMKASIKAKKNGPISPMKVELKDENGDVVATYASQAEASKKLGICQMTISNRCKMTKEHQLKKFGYILVPA